MPINHSLQDQEHTQLAARAFDLFVHTELAQAAARFENSEAEIYIYCHLAPEGEPTRRLLVVTDKHSQVVRVCIEAAYELFAGEVHHHVERVGTVNRSDMNTDLENLVREAYQRLIAWKPTHDNIWDDVY